jgi:hypothetical protein
VADKTPSRMKKVATKKLLLFFYFVNSIMNIRILCFISYIGNVSMIKKFYIETCEYKIYAIYPCQCNKIFSFKPIYGTFFAKHTKLPSTYAIIYVNTISSNNCNGEFCLCEKLCYVFHL